MITALTETKQVEMEHVYVEAAGCEGGLVHCGLNTAVISFTAAYLECHRFRIHLVRSQNANSTCDISQTGLCGAGESDSLLDITQVPDLVQQCCLPAMVTDGDYLARAGLCSVLRHMVKVTDSAEPSKQWHKLLGFKGICLKACAEVSAWTKFCEVDLPEGITRALQQRSQSSYRENETVELPLELCKLEHHLDEPAIISNIGKKRHEAIKKLKQTSPTNELQETNFLHHKSPQGQDSKLTLPGMEHLYAEGTELTLTDLVLFAPISLYLNYHKENIPSVEKELPLVFQWYRRLLSEDKIKEAALHCGLSIVDLDDIPACITPHGKVVHPSVSPDKLSLRNASKKKLKVNMNLVGAILEKLESSGVYPTSGQHPCGTDVQLSWEMLPAELNPIEGDLPAQRVKRKCQQLENLVSAVCCIARPGDVVVDFCSGGGHLGLVLTHYLPKCKVILVENKEESISRARGRIEKLGLDNITLYQCNLDYFNGHFDVGVCLHACGVATDLVLQRCIDNNASFIICPCCYGSIQNTHTVTYPRSDKFRNSVITSQDFILLGHAADQTQVNIPQADTGKACMMLVDSDRASLAKEHGYEVDLCSLQPLSCSPKNNLLIGNRPLNRLTPD